jgi:hypothetical protein
MSAVVQLRLDGLPVDPEQLAELLSFERAALYRELGLDWDQREAAEAAVRLVLARRYRRATR